MAKRKTPQQTVLPHRKPTDSPHFLPTLVQHRQIVNRFGIDRRSLVLFRVLIALILLWDLAVRAMDWGAMYSDGGMFSRSLICRYYTDPSNWSFHFASGSLTYLMFLWMIATSFAVALLIGWQTRWATIGSWLMLVSLHNRVPPILNGGDNLLRMLLFWGIYLPLGEHASVDSRSLGSREGERTDRLTIVSAASFGILLQMAMMYFFSAWYKSQPDWWSGHALGGILGHDAYAKPWGDLLRQFPQMLQVATWFILGLEWFAPVLLFTINDRLRFGGLVLLATMHAAIELTMWVGLFSLVSCAGLVLFVPKTIWDRIWPIGGVQQAGPDVITGSSTQLHDATRSAAAIPLLELQGVGLCLSLWVLAINLQGFGMFRWLAPVQWGPFVTGCGMGQTWNMFASIPSRDGWFVGRAKLTSGAEVDLLRQGELLSWDRPSFPASLYGNHRWRKLFREMAYDDSIGFQVFRLPASQFLCRHWESEHQADAEQITEFDLVFCPDKSQSMHEEHSGEVGSLPQYGSDREQLVHLE